MSAVWLPSADGRAQGPAVASSQGFLGEDVTNNVAEYEGLYQCMLRAARVRDRHVIFEVDSMLVAQQLARHRPWACRSPALVDIHNNCLEIGSFLSLHNIEWIVQHIYLEYNKVADTLANCAINEMTNVSTTNW